MTSIRFIKDLSLPSLDISDGCRKSEHRYLAGDVIKNVISIKPSPRNEDKSNILVRVDGSVNPTLLTNIPNECFQIGEEEMDDKIMVKPKVEEATVSDIRIVKEVAKTMGGGRKRLKEMVDKVADLTAKTGGSIHRLRQAVDFLQLD